MNKILKFIMPIAFAVGISFSATAQNQTDGYSKLIDRYERLISRTPGDIFQAYKMFPKADGGTAYDSLYIDISKELNVLAQKANGRSNYLNAFTNTTDKKAYIFEIANPELDQLMIDASNEYESLQSMFYQNKTRGYYKGGYKKGFLVVRDSLYQVDKNALIPFAEGVLNVAKNCREYLIENNLKQMLESEDEGERIQYLEAQGKILVLLLAPVNSSKLVVIEEGAKLVAMCKESPEDCEKLSSGK